MNKVASENMANMLLESQKLYEDLLSRIQVLVFQCDGDGSFKYLNQSWERVFGYQLDEMLGHKLTDFLYPTSKINSKSFFVELCERKRVSDYQLEFIGKDNKLIVLSIDLYPDNSQNENKNSLLGIAYDITEQKRTNELIQQKKEELDIFFNAAIDMLCIANTDGFFLRLNPEWEKILGYTNEELLSKRFLDFVHPDDVESTIAAISKLDSQETVLNFVNRYKCKDGSYKYLEWKSAPAGNIIYAAARDITIRKEVEEKLKSLNRELNDANVQKDKFLSIISHDLRSPISSLVGLSEAITVDSDNLSRDQLLEYIQHFNETSKRVHQLVENLLDWSKSQSGTKAIKLTRINLNELASDVKVLLETAARNKEIKIDFDICDDCFVVADEYMLRTVLRNLVSNAIKFSFPQSKIIIKHRLENNENLIEIKDSGVGISPEKLPLIFSFEDSYSTTGTKGERGTGLGLPLCKEFIEKHGGKIWVESQSGEGSKFYFSLPKAPK